jgi:hypothetical protein
MSEHLLILCILTTLIALALILRALEPVKAKEKPSGCEHSPINEEQVLKWLIAERDRSHLIGGPSNCESNYCQRLTAVIDDLEHNLAYEKVFGRGAE